MHFFGLGHKTSLPSLKQDSPNVSSHHILRRRFGRSQLSISSPVVAGSTADSKKEKCKQTYLFPEIFPAGLHHSRSNSQLKSSGPSVAPRPDFSASTPCLPLPRPSRPLLKVSLPEMPEDLFSQMRSKPRDETKRFSPLDEMVSPSSRYSAISAVTPSAQFPSHLPLVSATQGPSLQSVRASSGRGPLTSNAVTPEDLAFLADRQKVVLPRPSPAPPIASSTVTFSQLIPQPLRILNRATRLVRTRTPLPLRSKRSSASLNVHASQGALSSSSPDCAASSTLPTPGSVPALPPLPKRLSIIPEAQAAARKSCAAALRISAVPLSEVPEALEQQVINSGAPHEASEASTSQQVALPTTLTYRSFPPTLPKTPRFDFAALAITHDLKRMRMLAGEICRSGPSSVAALVTGVVLAGKDAVATGEKRGEPVFLGFGVARVLCGVSGVTRGGQQVRRCIKA